MIVDLLEALRSIESVAYNRPGDIRDAVLTFARDAIAKAEAQLRRTGKTCTITFTVEDIYGKPLDELKVPDGFELTGEFRPPGRQEGQKIWLSPNEDLELEPGLSETPRLFLRRSSKMNRVNGPWIVKLSGEER